MRRATTVLGLLALGAATLGCGAGGLASNLNETPGIPGESACDDKALDGVISPIVVDWPASARADLEEAMEGGVAVVAYSCDSVKVLPDCKVEGEYGYLGVTPKKESSLVEGSDNIRATFGGAAWGVSGSLERTAKLDLSYVLVGKKKTARMSLHRGELEGGDFCAGATHYVKRADIGGWAMATGTDVKAGLAATVFSQGVSADTASKEARTKKDGDPKACEGAGKADDAAPDGCSAMIWVSLAPIKGGEGPGKGDSVTVTGVTDGRGCPGGKTWVGGVCTANPGGAYLCKEGDNADCTKQCRAGSHASCNRLAKLLLYPNAARSDEDDVEQVDPNVPELVKQLGSLQKQMTAACEADEPDACAGIFFVHVAPALMGGDEDTSRAGLTKAWPFIQTGCVAGDFFSCTFIRTTLLGDGDVAEQTGIDARSVYPDLLERGCTGGAGVPCGYLAAEYATGEITSRSPKKALAFAETACLGNFAAGCLVQASLLGDQDACRAAWEAAPRDFGFAHDFDAACSDETLDPIDDDESGAKRAMARACVLGIDAACK